MNIVPAAQTDLFHIPPVYIGNLGYDKVHRHQALFLERPSCQMSTKSLFTNWMVPFSLGNYDG
jgi:hypothetical protein